MKKIFRFSILLLALILPATALAYDFEVDGIYYNINGNEVTVTNNGSVYSGSVVIPATVTYDGTTYRVTAIGSSAFSGCRGLTSIVIPNSVTKIGNFAFYSCTRLTSIVIPNSVTSISNEAFYECTGLTSIDIANSVTSIGDKAFSFCYGLTSIIIPNSVTSIGSEAFVSCNRLTSIVIPNSVTEIGNEAFFSCLGLTSIVIPNSVTSIGDEAFWGCTGLTDVYSYIVDLSRISSGNEQFYSYDWGYSGRTLHVLQGTASAYQTNEDWYPYFGQIVEDIFMGDVNGDLEINIDDVTALIEILLSGETALQTADCDQNGRINIDDVTTLINYLLSGSWN